MPFTNIYKFVIYFKLILLNKEELFGKRHPQKAAKEFVMKKQNFVLAMLALVLAFGLTFASCKADSEPTYTVWAGIMSYSDWSAAYGQGGTLSDNTYVQVEIPNSDWDMYKNTLPDSWKHDWTEDQIYVWFLESTFTGTAPRQLTTDMMASRVK
jgi:hypothetical protein